MKDEIESVCTGWIGANTDPRAGPLAVFPRVQTQPGDNRHIGRQISFITDDDERLGRIGRFRIGLFQTSVVLLPVSPNEPPLPGQSCFEVTGIDISLRGHGRRQMRCAGSEHESGHDKACHRRAFLGSE
jgi:hypothetical protein